MAQNTTIPVPARTWTQLTNAAASSISFQASDHVILVKGTATDVAPTDTLGSITCPPFNGPSNVALSEVWPGVAGVNRVWVYCQADTQVMVSHA